MRRRTPVDRHLSFGIPSGIAALFAPSTAQGRAAVRQRGWTTSIVIRRAVALGLSALASVSTAQPPAFDAGLRDRIDRFVESERVASGIPGIALAIVNDGQTTHARGFGHDGIGHPISADTPFPIGSLTKSFTALLVRQAIEAGQLAADAPVRRYLPWFRVADAEASARITLRHLLNHTSGFSHASGFAPLLERSDASIEATARGLASVSLNRPVGEGFEYSNLNYVLLGAVLQAVTGKPWQTLMHERVFRPLAMTHSHTGFDAARPAGMTAVHRMWFGWPVAHDVWLTSGFAPTGSLVSSAGDLARYLVMLLADGTGPAGAMVSPHGVAQLLAPAAPPRRIKGASAGFECRYGEGWCVGTFAGAPDARWHDGGLASFRAWMVLLPESRQAVVLLINANSEMSLNDAKAVMRRLPVGVVSLLRGKTPPSGPSLRSAYRPINVLAVLVIVVVAASAVWVVKARRTAWSVVLLAGGVALVVALHAAGVGVAMLSVFAPDVALVVGAVVAVSCLPAALRFAQWSRRRLADSNATRPP